jgi:calcineurin-like phosphoesterase family protein
MKIHMISDTHFGIYQNNLDKWLNMMEDTFYKFVIPYLKENVKEGDILIHLGDLFDNRTSLPIIILNKVERILKDISDIVPIHIMVGNHDLYNKGSNDINSVRLFGYINKNITVYEKTETLEIGGKKIVFMPWVEKRLDMIKELSNNLGDYLFCHSDLNGCKMHLNSVAHRNADKIDVDDFNKYKRVFSGHIHIRQVNKNFTFIGSLWQMDRNDYNDQKGITVLDLSNDTIDFIPNTYSPIFKKVKVISEGDIEKLDELSNSKDYIDISISNSLLISNRKLRRKLEVILEKSGFSSVDYIDDIVLGTEEQKEKDDVVEFDESSMDISIQLDYGDYIKEYIIKQKYESDKFKDGVVDEFDEIIKIYNENYTKN